MLATCGNLSKTSRPSVGFRHDVTTAEATDVVWTMTSPEFFSLFVEGRGWSVETYETWFAEALQRLLLEF